MTDPDLHAVRHALGTISIAHADDVRGSVTLPDRLPGAGDLAVAWTSSRPDVVCADPRGPIAPGLVTRPAAGSEPVRVALTASVETDQATVSREIVVTVRAAVDLAPYSGYLMSNFARSNSTEGQQIHMAASVGNDPLRWRAVNRGAAVLRSTEGMHGVRDPSIVRSPEGDRFFLVATDLNVDGAEFGWRGWDWAQSDASRHIEVWESTDLRTWSAQRHVLVAPEEAGMAYAPEAIWDETIAAYVVFWTSSIYPAGTRFSADPDDPVGRHPLTRNQTLFATTRDFITFTPARTMIDRPGRGTLDAVIIRDEVDGSFHRFVCDRSSTGEGVTHYASDCGYDDIYQERASSILAPADEWELVRGCITHSAMGATYAEGPMVIRANPGDSRGGYYLWADQHWANAPAGDEEQLAPYWSPDLASPEWTPVEWETPEYEHARGVMRHGHVLALTAAEHAAVRGAEVTAVRVSGPARPTVRVGESIDRSGIRVAADYTDGIVDVPLLHGFGGYTVSGHDPAVPGRQKLTVSHTVAGSTCSADIVIDVVTT